MHISVAQFNKVFCIKMRNVQIKSRVLGGITFKGDGSCLRLFHSAMTVLGNSCSILKAYAGLTDSNPWNLATTVETNILEALKEYGCIDSYEKVGGDSKMSKYIIRRSAPESNEKNEGCSRVGKKR